MISSMPMHKKNYPSKLLYQSKLKKSDMSIINDVLQENEFIKKKVVSDICHYSELERSKLWIEDANSLNLNNFLLVEYWNNDSQYYPQKLQKSPVPVAYAHCRASLLLILHGCNLLHCDSHPEEIADSH